MSASFLFPLVTLVVFYPAPREPEVDDRGPGFFGVRMVDVSGINITSVEPGSPADKAGIRDGDYIQSIDSTPVSTVDDARELIARLRPSACIIGVAIRRGDEKVSIKIKVGVRPDTVP